MPTGYTDVIEDGVTFPEFAMRCARGMSALMNIRDESFDYSIPIEFSPSDYHKKEIEKLKIELERIIKTPIKEAESIAQKEHCEKVRQREDYIERQNVLKKKYNDMLLNVKAWNPPTSNHNGLKRFMIEQIVQSIEYDISLDENDNYVGYFNEPIQKSGEEWINENIARIGNDIKYHTEEYQKEVKRTKERNKWIRELRESLK